MTLSISTSRSSTKLGARLVTWRYLVSIKAATRRRWGRSLSRPVELIGRRFPGMGQRLSGWIWRRRSGTRSCCGRRRGRIWDSGQKSKSTDRDSRTTHMESRSTLALPCPAARWWGWFGAFGCLFGGNFCEIKPQLGFLLWVCLINSNFWAAFLVGSVLHRPLTADVSW